MQSTFFTSVVTVALVGTLAGCGAGDTSSTLDLRSKQVFQSDKAATPTSSITASSYQTVVQELYISYFGRPADPAGLINFEVALASANAPTTVPGLANAYNTNTTIQALIDSFNNSKESQALYGSSTTASFVQAVFQNVIGRQPLQAGLNFWVSAIDSGSLSKGDAALSIMAGAMANTTSQGQLDAQLISSRLAVANYFTAQLSTQNVISAYAGTTAAATARNMLGVVTAATNITTYETTVSATVAALGSSAGGLGSPTLKLFAGNVGGAGSANGVGATARFNYPSGVATDSIGNVYVVDQGNNVIRKISPAGAVTTLAGTAGVAGHADGTGAAATFYSPSSIATDGAGNIYVADTFNELIRKITPGGLVTTIAGQAGITGSVDGAGDIALFRYPSGVTTDSFGNIFVADLGNNAIREISPAGMVTTFAGTAGAGGSVVGTGAAATINTPTGVATDSAGNVYVIDFGAIQKITPSGVVTTVISNIDCSGIAVDGTGNLYVSLPGNTIGKITPNGQMTTFAGNSNYVAGSNDGTGVAAGFNGPLGIAIGNSGNLYVADSGNNIIRAITPAGVVTTIAGDPSIAGSAEGLGSAASFNLPEAAASDSAGNIYIADTYNDIVRKITPAGLVTTIAGTAGLLGSSDGTGAAARFNLPFGIAADRNGNVYVTDTFDTIRKITSAGVVTTLAGNPSKWGSADGTGAAATFDEPVGIAVDSAGNLYVADSGGCTIRKVTQDGVVTTFAGAWQVVGSADGIGVAARFNGPTGVAVDSADNIYVADTFNAIVRKITPAGVVTTLAGTPGVIGSADGTGAAASFTKLQGIVVDSANNVYVSDWGNNTIRKITPSGVVTTVVGVAGQTTGFVGGSLPGGVVAPLGMTISGTSLYITTENGVVVINNLP